LVEDIERFFGSHDVLLAPVSYGPALKRCKQGSPLDFDGEMRPCNNYCEPYVVQRKVPPPQNLWVAD